MTVRVFLPPLCYHATASVYLSLSHARAANRSLDERGEKQVEGEVDGRIHQARTGRGGVKRKCEQHHHNMSVLESIRRSVGLSPTKANSAVKSSKGHDERLAVYGYLILESSKGLEKERFPLRKRVTTLGR